MKMWTSSNNDDSEGLLGAYNIKIIKFISIYTTKI